MPTDRPTFPYDEVRAGSADPDHQAALDAFHTEYASDTPDGARLHERAASVRDVPSFVGPFERWWLDPKVQAFFAELGATGL